MNGAQTRYRSDGFQRALVPSEVVEERSVGLRRWIEKSAGGIRSANADMSNDKAGE